MKTKLKFILLVVVFMVLLPSSVIADEVRITITVPLGATITTPNPPGTIRVDLGANGGIISIDGVNLATASAGVSVVFNTNNTTTAIVGSTSITMPTTNGPHIVDNGNGTVTVTLPGQLPITIPANGGNWYAVFFNSNGGSTVGAQIIESGTGIVMPATPSQTGYDFVGWYSNAALTNAWNFNVNMVNDITTLFARWDADYIPSPEPEPTLPPVPEPEVPTTTPVEGDLVEEPPVEEIPAEEIEEVTEMEPPLQEEPQEEPYEEAPEVETEPGEQPAEIETAVNESDETAAGEVTPLSEDADNEYTEDDEKVIIYSSWSDFGNFTPLNDNVAHYRIVSRPTGARFLHGELPAFTGGEGLLYTISFRTNVDNVQRVIAANIPANRPFRFLSPQLQDEETITEISIMFDTVPVGFGIGDTITYSFVLLDKENASIRWTIEYGEAWNRNYMLFSILDNVDTVSGLHSGNYELASWANLQTVISTVQTILDNPNVTVAELETANMMLQQAINDLAPTPVPSPFTFGSILSTAAIIAWFGLIIFTLVKLLKKRMALIPKNACLYL